MNNRLPYNRPNVGFNYEVPNANPFAQNNSGQLDQAQRNNRLNMSSTLYDFIRETENDIEGPVNGNRNDVLQVNRAGNGDLANQLDQTGLEIDTEIDFLDTQQLEYI